MSGRVLRTKEEGWGKGGEVEEGEWTFIIRSVAACRTRAVASSSGEPCGGNRADRVLEGPSGHLRGEKDRLSVSCSLVRRSRGVVSSRGVFVLSVGIGMGGGSSSHLRPFD